jgi:D-alanyl-D-alanine carboxypeptidase
MTGTLFANPNGLPGPNQLTTARDIGLLARALIRDFPEYGYLFGLERIKIGKRTIRAHNKLLGKFDGADGMKTGYICASGYNIAASATRGDRRIVAVVLGATSGNARREAAADLLERGFADASREAIAPEKLEELSPDREYGVRPEHMGPVVCTSRYGNNEPYAVDAELRAQSEARKVAEIANAPKLASATAFPLIGGQKVPIPTLRPER